MTDKKGKNDILWYGILGTILLAAVLIMVGKMMVPEEEITTAVPIEQQNFDTHISALETELESKLIENLGQMAGVGKVQVSVVLESGLRSVFAYNDNITKKNSTETDKSGGKRETEEITENKQIVIGNSGGKPVVVYEERPSVAGVFVIAEGAKDPKIRENIHNAVKTLLNISTDKVTVNPMGGV